VCLLPEYLARDCHIPWHASTTTIYELKTQKIIKTLGSTRVCIEIDKALVDNVLIFIVDSVIYYQGIIIGSPWCNSSGIACEYNGSQLHCCNIDRVPYADMDDTVFGRSLNHLVTSSSANLASEKLTLINALAGETKVDVLVSNATSEFVTLKANHFLARRVDVIPVSEIECLPFSREINVNDVKLPVELSKMEQEKLLKLLNNHRQCFVTDMIPNITKKPINSTLIDMSMPYSVLNSEQQNQGIVHDIDSTVLRVYKKKEETRVLVHQNNMIVKRLPYPLLPTEDYLQLFTYKTLFTRLDLVNNHLDIPLKTERKIVDRTITPLNNAPFEYTAFTNCSTTLGNTKTTINYFDHYIVPADDWTDMENKLNNVLTALRESNLTVRLNKCVFASPSIEFQGYEISNGLLKPSHSKVLEIVKYKTPETTLSVRRFIGLTRFFDKFLPNFAEVIKPIADLCRKGVTFEWTDKHQEVFKSFKLQVVRGPVLHLFSSKHYTELHIDVTVHLLSAMLYQKDKDGENKLVYCISKATSDIERSYHFDKLILRALFWSLEQLSYWLKNIVVTVVMDCQSMCYMNVMKITDLECFQYYERLIQKQNLLLIHNATKIIKPKYENILHTMTGLQTSFHLQHMQYYDQDIIKIIKELSERPKIHKNKYEFENGVLYYISSTNTVNHKLLMIPKIMRKLVVVHFHDLHGHLSLDETIKVILNKFFFPRLRRYVKLHIKYCSVCTPQKLSRDQKLNIQLGNRPFDTIHIKHFGPFPKSNKGNQYLFVITDNLTIYTHIYASPSCNTKAMIEHLEYFTNKFRLPKRIVSDQSKIFTSLHFCEFCSTNGIENRQVYGHQPQTNQDVERINNNILAVIYTYINRKEVWDHELDALETFLNITNVTSLKMAPLRSALKYSEIYQDKIIDILRLQEQHGDLSHDVQYEYALRMEFGQFMWKNWFKPYCETKQLCKGSVVYLKNITDSTKDKYLGPMIIIKQSNEFYYTAIQFDFVDFSCYVFPDVHISSLKIYEGTVSSFEYFTKNNIDTSVQITPVWITDNPAVPSF